MTTSFALQIGGLWIAVDEVDLGGGLALERATSEFVSFGGTRRRQRAARSPRTWDWKMSAASAQTVRWLILAAQGLAGDVWLYDLSAAQANMLDPRDVVGRDATQPLMNVDGPLMLSLPASYTITRRLRGGQLYTLSGWTTHTAATTIGTYNTGAGAVNIVAPAGTGSRYWSTTFTPAADGTTTIIVTVAGKTSGLRLTEGVRVDSIQFMPGENTPCQVSVDDPDRTLQFLFTNQLPLTDYAVTLAEVG